MSATTSHSDHSLRCVWMDAGMLSFKLCDRYFDCDRCPVDAIFRGDRPLSPPPAASPPLSVLVDLPGDLDPAWIPLLRPLAECHLDRDLAYSARHLWARELGDRQVMVGLDDCLLRLLPEETSIVLRALDSTVDKGEPLGWAYAGPSALPLPAPASGRLVRRNTTDPAPLSFFRETHPSPWLVMLDEAEPDSLCDVEEAARATASDTGRIGGAFCSSGILGGGNETTVMSILEALLIHGMVVVGNAKIAHYGPVAIGAPDKASIEECAKYGARIGELAQKMFA